MAHPAENFVEAPEGHQNLMAAHCVTSKCPETTSCRCAFNEFGCTPFCLGFSCVTYDLENSMAAVMRGVAVPGMEFESALHGLDALQFQCYSLLCVRAGCACTSWVDLNIHCLYDLHTIRCVRETNYALLA